MEEKGREEKYEHPLHQFLHAPLLLMLISADFQEVDSLMP